MNREWVGDAKDFAKAFLFNLLRKHKLTKHIKVAAFFTEKRGSTALQRYTSMLGILDNDVLLVDEQFSGSRDDYINDVISEIEGDIGIDTLFLDPDTGIHERKGCTKKHVTHENLQDVLTSAANLLIIVYDESYQRVSAEDVKGRMKVKLAAICKDGISGFGYYGNALNLVFLADLVAKDRLKNVRRVLSELLPKGRITPLIVSHK